MNYYNPYLFSMPTTSIPKTGGFLSNLFRGGGIKFGSILSGTQKVLNFTNQLIPVVKQVQPMFKNAKTMFRVMNEFKKTDPHNTYKQEKKTTTNQIETEKKQENYTDGPTFFI